jgi:aminoglycoside 6'-N-acetyltransferase I
MAELLAAAGHWVAPHELAARIDAIRCSAGTVLIAAEWGPPSGLVALHWHPSLEADQKSATISALLVDRQARRRGIGRLLVKAAAQAARVAGCGSLTLSVAGGEEALAAFCESTGFVSGGTAFSRGLRKKG